VGIGDWGLGIGDWGLGPIPNPQSPIPNPQSPIPKSDKFHLRFSIFVYIIKNNNILDKVIKKVKILMILFVKRINNYIHKNGINFDEIKMININIKLKCFYPLYLSFYLIFSYKYIFENI